MGIAEYIRKLEQLYNRAKLYDMVFPHGILASKYLYNIFISDSNEKLIRAISADLSHETMKTQIKKIFGNLSHVLALIKFRTLYVGLDRAEENSI